MTILVDKTKFRITVREMLAKYAKGNLSINTKVDEVRSQLLNQERIILTYDASKLSTDINGNVKSLLIATLSKNKSTMIYSPTKSTIIFNIEKGSFQEYKEALEEFFLGFPDSGNIYYSIALLSGDSYADKPDYSLNHFMLE